MEPKRVAWSLALCAVLMLPSATSAETVEANATEASRETLSVSRFLIDIARAVDPTLAENATVDDAVDRLATVGLEVPEDLDLDRTVTEGDVVRFASTAGLRLRSSEPSEPFPAEKMESLRLLLVGNLDGTDELARDGVRAGEGVNNAGGSDRAREKRKKKKVFESPSIPPGQEGKN